MIAYMKFYNKQIHRERSRLVVAWSGGRGEWSKTANGYGLSFWYNENGLHMKSGGGYTTPNIIKTSDCSLLKGELYGM